VRFIRGGLRLGGGLGNFRRVGFGGGEEEGCAELGVLDARLALDIRSGTEYCRFQRFHQALDI
jgi:hypothetical protein